LSDNKLHDIKSRKLLEKLRRREVKVDETQRMKVKRSEEYEVLEEVFDKPTLMTVYKLMNLGVLENLFGVVRTGKESRIYRGITAQGEEVALKIYLTVSAEFRKGMLAYIQGDPRFTRVRRDTRGLIYTWAQKEFANLKKAYDVGVRVPQPLAVENNVLVMKFIGSDGIPAPLLREVELPNPTAVYRSLLNAVRVLYREAELVHGDLSEFNVLMFESEPYIIDMSQSLPRTHPRAQELLLRDLTNLTRFFNKVGVKVQSPTSIMETLMT